MGFLANTFSSCQFKITTETGAKLAPESIAHALELMAFKPIDETADERSVGWANIFDPSLTKFDTSGALFVGGHAAFSLRLDQRKVPAAVLRERIKLAEELFLQENPGFTKVPKHKREEIKEAQRAALLAKLIPVPTIYDVVWNLETNVVTFCNLSVRAMDLFHDMFKKSFSGHGLRLITPYDRAEVECSKFAADSKDVGLIDALAAANKAGSDSVLSILKENEWIGHDFLLWLLWHEQDGGYVRPEMTAYIDQKLLLVGPGESGPEKIVFTGGQSKISAIKAALASGKQITVARIFIEQEENGWAFTLRGSNFEFAAYKCPAVRLEKDNTTDELMERQAVFLERVALVDKGRELFNDVFRAFLADRLTIEWAAKEADIDAWKRGEA